jgi:hypothetical protein
MSDTINVRAAIDGYIECLLWSESCRGELSHEHNTDDPSDCDASIDSADVELAVFAREAINSDVEGFIDGAVEQRPDVFDGMDAAQIGHDFLLTRNRHGAGFWDRGLGERGEWLTEWAHTYGSTYAYIGDDGAVYVG